MDDLITGLRRRDEAALAELYDRCGRTVYGLALRITGDTGAAEEICLDAFWQLWQQADKFDATQGSIQNWLCTIARSRSIDRVRARGARKRVLAEDPTDVTVADRPDEAVDVAQQRRLVRQAMATLSPDQRAALALAYYEGLSHSQIAARLEEPLGTVKTRIRQAMGVLRRTLGPVLST
ncbi:MAG: sigma-70 family RNA polymerase sigma factor [Candidatus Binatia bacterium]